MFTIFELLQVKMALLSLTNRCGDAETPRGGVDSMYHPRGREARISCDYTYKGHRVAVLENELLAVTLLLDQGGSIVEFRYKPLDVDVMYRSPWGMRTWGSWVPTSANSRGAWIDHYPGGWQVVFPSGGGASGYKGAELGTHGEADLMAWDYEVLQDRPEEVALRLTLTTQRLPFRLERELRLAQGSGALRIRESVENLSPQALPCMWGQHPALGEPFLGPDLELHLPACRISRGPGGADQPGRFVPDSTGTWPWLPGRDGRPVDLRRLPAREERASDMLYAAELADGWAAACNGRLGLGFGLSWPLELWPYLWIWQELGGHMNAPWFGRAYALGLEPFSSLPHPEQPGLAGAVANGTALIVAPGEIKTASYNAVAFPFQTGRAIHRITREGDVLYAAH
ncbi:DUF4432 family protein [Paenibacillus sp. HJGM_3]|uniref:DUF4432 family protein n=1 Tax=Paenibacillus sp. HJGM_3 TaxID=3379816 RepID=UPI003867643B